jgi:phosphatidate cytidylyltransferase
MRGGDVDEPDEFDPEIEVSAEPVTERVRIHGAEAAGTLAGGQGASDELPTDSLGDKAASSLDERYRSPLRSQADSGSEPSQPERPLLHEDVPFSGIRGEVPRYLPEDPSGAVPLLPHWTDPPTGQVPAVVARHDEDDRSEPWASSGGPSWREHDHEWDEVGFEPSLLGDDETRLGALDERPLSERRPWEFGDLSSSGEAGSEESEESPADDTRKWGHEPWWSDRGEDDEVDAPESFWADEGVEGAVLGSSSRSGDPVTARVAGEAAQDPERRASASEEKSIVASISSSPFRGTSTGGGSGSVAGRRLHRRRPVRSADPAGGGAGRNVPVAIATGLGVALLALVCFAFGSVASLVLSTVVVTLAVAECYAALRRAGHRPATLLGLVATVGVMVSVYAKGVAALPLVMVLVVVTSMIWYLAGVERGSPVEGIASTVFGFVWVGLLGSFAALMLAPSQYPHRHGVAFLLGAIIATVAEDVGALSLGGWFGRHPLAPRVSPRKTWEGFVGGAVLAVAASAGITGQIHPWTPGKAAVLGLVVAVIAPIGDLCESLIKRELGLKDIGSLLPGHGGVLDRVDALLFVLPATYYLVRVLHLG